MRLFHMSRRITRQQNVSIHVGLVLALFVGSSARSFGQTSFAPPASATQTSPVTGTPAVGAQPKYPGIGPTEDKVEAEIGAFTHQARVDARQTDPTVNAALP